MAESSKQIYYADISKQENAIAVFCQIGQLLQMMFLDAGKTSKNRQILDFALASQLPAVSFSIMCHSFSSTQLEAIGGFFSYSLY